MSPAVRPTVLSLTVLAAVALAWWWLFPSDERAIRLASHELAQRLSVPPGEPDVARLTRVAGIAQSLHLDIAIEFEGTGGRIDGRNAVVAVAGRQRYPSGLELTLENLEVAVNEDRQAAHGRAMVAIRERNPGGGPDTVDVHRLTLEWQRTGDEWQLAHVLIGQSPGL